MTIRSRSRLGWRHDRDPELRRIDVVVDALAQQLVRLVAAIRRPQPVHREARTVRVGRLAADLQAVDRDLGRTNVPLVEQRAEAVHLLAVEDVDVRVLAAEQRRVDGEEEAPLLDLVILDVARSVPAR